MGKDASGGSGGAGKNRSPLSGSGMSRRQLARTVIDGRLVTFRFLDGEAVVGYLAGMDDFHWMVITPTATTHLVHKGSTPCITIAAESTYEAEERHEDLERVIGPFREVLGQENLVPPHTVRPVQERAASC